MFLRVASAHWDFPHCLNIAQLFTLDYPAEDRGEVDICLRKRKMILKPFLTRTAQFTEFGALFSTHDDQPRCWR